MPRPCPESSIFNAVYGKLTQLHAGTEMRTHMTCPSYMQHAIPLCCSKAAAVYGT